MKPSLWRSASACALGLAIAPLAANAQQSLPTIEVGARTHGAGRTAGKPQGTRGISSNSTQPGPGNSSGDGSGSGSYWQQLAEKAKIPEGSYVAPYASTGTKTDTPIMDTPLNVQVVTPQQLRDRQVTNIVDAVKYTSGVTFLPNSSTGFVGSQGQLFIRGFAITDYLRNGFLTYGIGGTGYIDMANVESIEVLKGAPAILYGMVEPGGLINIVTKQPQEKASYSAQQLIGSFRNYRTVVSATGPVTQDKSILYRVDAAYTNNHSWVDLAKERAFFIAPVVRWNINSQTQITAEFQYYNSKPSLFMNVVPAYNGILLPSPRGRNYGEDTGVVNETFLSGVRWSHEFDNNWKLSHQVQYTRSNNNGVPYVYPVNVSGINDRFIVNRISFSSYNETSNFSSIANLVGHFNTGVLSHTLLTGTDYYRYSSWGQSTYQADSFIDFFHPLHPGTPFDPTVYPWNIGGSNIYTYGIYLQDQIKLPFGIQLMGGARYQNVRTLNRTGVTATDLALNPSFDKSADQRVTPRVGVLWRPQGWLSVYANYAEGFGASIGKIFSGNKPVPSTDARQWEMGAKTEFFEGKLRATGAYYDLSKTNVPTNDLAHPGYSLVTGEVNAKGVEFDLQGEVRPGWNMTLAYSHTETKITKSSQDDTQLGERFYGVPRNQASIFTTYEFQHGDWKGLKFGGGVSYQDATRLFDYSGLKLRLDNPAFATIDLMGAYSFNIGATKMIAQLNFSNLLDTKYYVGGQLFARPGSDQGGFGLEYRGYGEPRRIVGSISASF